MSTGASFKRKGDKNRYSFSDRECIGRTCWAPGMFQHRAPMSGGGSRNTGSPDSPCCLNRAYHGCPIGPVGEESTACHMCNGADLTEPCCFCGGTGMITVAGLPLVQIELKQKRKAGGWKLA